MLDPDPSLLPGSSLKLLLFCEVSMTQSVAHKNKGINGITFEEKGKCTFLLM